MKSDNKKGYLQLQPSFNKNSTLIGFWQVSHEYCQGTKQHQPGKKTTQQDSESTAGNPRALPEIRN